MRARRAGFTLIELVIAMSIIALLAGVILPATGAMMRSDSRRATTTELELIAEAAQDFYRDTRVFPADSLDLLASSVAGWSGPYLRGTVDDPWSGQSGYVVDGFGTDYVYSSSGLTLTITSSGVDRTQGTADDISLSVNATPILRELTLDELKSINTAITQYNSVHLATSPLSGTYAIALASLESAGFLPAGSGYGADEFGDAYTGDRVGVSPMTAARSVNVGN